MYISAAAVVPNGIHGSWVAVLGPLRFQLTIIVLYKFLIKNLLKD